MTIISFCATTNSDLTQYYSTIETQSRDDHDTPIIDILADFLYNATRQWFVANKRLPQHILIYRDGVSEGMLKGVTDHEIPQFDKVVRKVAEERNVQWQPELLFTVVTKRIQTRLLSTSSRDYSNPDPGTVVDSSCTRHNRFDFFLVAQSVFQGTVTPTRFLVARNDTNLTPEQIQLLTYKMCHLYVNWCGTVRVPAPCQYAHKLAFLTAQSLHQKANPSLSQKLHFL